MVWDHEVIDLGMAWEFENAKHPEHSEGDKGPRHLDDGEEDAVEDHEDEEVDE